MSPTCINTFFFWEFMPPGSFSNYSLQGTFDGISYQVVGTDVSFSI